ncbi:MAG: GNAT family N-acetyltransferase [Candidatus Poribacteria bacterium]|nr:GNAT family N-acetyltransferase [Candidatus Poribacteria bacterium]
MDPILIDFPESFESERLTIRAPHPGDGAEENAAVRETFDDLKVWMPWAKEIPTLEESEALVRRKRCEFLSREDLLLLLFLKGTNTMVGSSGLHRMDWDIPKFEIGYWCRKRFQGQGYITESTAAITKFAFEALGAKRVEIRCDSKNVRSRRIPERLGFELEGTLRSNMLSPSGELRDTLVFAKTRTN